MKNALLKTGVFFLIVSLCLFASIGINYCFGVSETHSGTGGSNLSQKMTLGKVVVNQVTDLNDFTETLDSFTGTLDRIVIDANGTDTDYSITLKDENAYTLFTKTDCNTSDGDYSYMLYQDDKEGNPWPNIPISGACSVVVADANGLDNLNIVIYYHRYWQ